MSMILDIDGTEDSREIRLNDLVIRFTIVLANTPLLRTDLDNANRELAATKRENELLRTAVKPGNGDIQGL
jgi:hypothetical protein